MYIFSPSARIKSLFNNFFESSRCSTFAEACRRQTLRVKRRRSLSDRRSYASGFTLQFKIISILPNRILHFAFKKGQLASLQFKIQNSKFKIKDNYWGLVPTTNCSLRQPVRAASPTGEG
ncbi:hypothetical protein NIES23_61540 (plasmid) [Trichormus variabilis NIES-23]|uniref:Uncharacterized protein n=1 Tax=Trichormus variabilis NIES-23 TaxID=1973479 RepID=A0A1Z4KWH9_ANAVA|nr:hypothetical protein NIES23_61540 [Trichormus variabilis NIES-23]